MEKQESKSKWDDLARELGAQVSPEIEQREQALASAEAASDRATSSRELPETPVAATTSKRPPADWGKLANDLGLPPIEPDGPPAVESNEPTRSELPAPRAASRTPSEDRPPRESRQPEESREHQERPPRRQQRGERQERGDRGRRSDRGSRNDRGDRSERSGRGERERDERGDRSERRERRPQPPRQRQQSERPREQRRPPIEQESADTERQPAHELPPVSQPAPPREEPPKPAAVSLWHKIFGSPAEQTAKFVDTPAAEAQDVSFRAFREEPISEIEETQYGSEAREGIGGDDSRDHVDHVEHDLDTAHPPSDDSEQKRGRSRRRRRGGRGRKQGDQRNAATRESTPREIHEAGEDFDDLGVTDTDDDGADPSLDDPFASEDIPEGAADDSDLSRSKAAQRAIPSWDEAIGYIVDCNMQERSQRRPAPRSQSRGASSRGRSRGSRNNHNNNK